jgi:DNA-binding IclR family transcriptional regulator
LNNRPHAAITERTLVEPEQIEQVWDDVWRAGCAINNEETIIGAIFLAAPIFDSADVICGSVSIGLPKSRYTADVRKPVAEGLKECCRRITADLKAAAYVHECAFEETPQEKRRAK